MAIVYQILFIIFVIAIIFCIFGIGYYAGRAREFNIRQRVCDDIKKQILQLPSDQFQEYVEPV